MCQMDTTSVLVTEFLPLLLVEIGKDHDLSCSSLAFDDMVLGANIEEGLSKCKKV